MMKQFFICLIALVFSGSAFSQTVPQLAKEWIGAVSHTNYGFGGEYNTDNHPSTGLKHNSYNLPRTLTIQEQDGQSVKLIYKTEKKSFTLIGTLSVDGKQLAVANENSFALLNVTTDTIIGCGTSRGAVSDPSYEDWKKSYATWCVSFKAVK